MFGGKEWGTVGSGIKWQVVGNKRKLQEWQRGVLRILGMGIVLSRGRVLSQGGQIMMWYPSWAKSEVGHLFLLCLKPACTQFVNHFFLDSQRERSYKIALVCLSVCNENQLCQFSQFWLLRFFLNLAQWKGTSIPIEWWRSHVDWCIGSPFLGPF